MTTSSIHGSHTDRARRGIIESITMTHVRTFALFTLAGAASGALAQVHGSDIILGMAEGRVVTGAVGKGQTEPYFPEHVYAGELDPVSFFGNEPGLDSAPGTFPPSSQVGFTIRKALRVWDGSGFTTIAEERLRVRLGPLGADPPILTPLTDTPVVGFGMTVNALGELHAHPGYTLQPPAGVGLYLIELELWHNSPTTAVSRPYWIVFNHDLPEPDHEAAVRHVYLTRVCPADRNLDRTVDFNDVLEFLNEFNDGSPDADLNGDGVVDFNDFLAFLNFFNGPCPIL